MENMFKKYLNETELASKQPVSGDSLVFTINETLDIEVDVIDHWDGTVVLDLDDTAISILENCGCVLEDDDDDEMSEQTFVPGPLKAGTPGPTTGISSDPVKLYTNQPTAVPPTSAPVAATPSLNLGTVAKGGEKQTSSASLPTSSDAANIFGATSGSGSGNLRPTTSQTSKPINAPLPKPKPTNTSGSVRPEYAVTGRMPQVTRANIPTGQVNPSLLKGLAGIKPTVKTTTLPSQKSGIEGIKPPPNVVPARGPSTGTGTMPYLREDICDLKKLAGMQVNESIKVKKADIKKIHDIKIAQKPDASLEEEDALEEAKYQGREVKLGKPTRGDVKKYKVYVRDPKTGNIKKVNFGDKNMEIKRDDPKRRKSFRARHNCSQKKDRTSAGYWSCRLWSTKPVSKIVKE